MFTPQSLSALYNHFSPESFLSVDPLGIVYELRQHTTSQLDIELGALFIAMISWGNRKAIRSAARDLMEHMHWHPSSYLLHHTYLHDFQDRRHIYRTLSVSSFRQVCANISASLFPAPSAPVHGDSSPCPSPSSPFTLEQLFSGRSTSYILLTLSKWLRPANCGTYGVSACKRLCMYLRWMIRPSAPDLGLWSSSFSPSDLFAIMDTHVMQLTAPLLTHRHPFWSTMQELTSIFRQWDRVDPLRYDVALMLYADIRSSHIQ